MILSHFSACALIQVGEDKGDKQNNKSFTFNRAKNGLSEFSDSGTIYELAETPVFLILMQ